MYIIGVDIGLQGAITIFNHKGKYIANYKMPIIKDNKSNKSKLNIDQLLTILTKYKNGILCCEQLHSLPHQGVVSMFNLGKQAGIIIGISKAIMKETIEVSPTKWQNYLNKLYKTNLEYKIDNKEYSEFFNHLVSLKSSKQSKINSAYLYYLIDKKLQINYKDNNIVDSYLIGWYCFMNYIGQ